ncbi:MAG: undecaprenyl/decaprenyl-phosphate alpha-N-acetylglucosaminyl 1-phosphate transferase [Deltaproteobacteria bacterium]|nr:undecaprenyl/decaprenyl-phosphate alpha-N-acetylglucosaminyl 1-phosphate transferase [Deltaproteobacteria bacterium]
MPLFLPLIPVMVTALALSFLSIPFLRYLGFKIKHLDHPAARKIHQTPVPLMGGVAILGASLISLIIFIEPFYFKEGAGILMGAVIMAALGFWDDSRGLSARTKLLGQAGAALVLIYSGVRVNLFQWEAANFGLTMLWVVGVTNAMNLMDNMDGVAGGTAVISAFFYFMIALFNGQYLVGLLGATLVGGSMGFLIYNLRPGYIFLGDCGSLLLGFVLAAMGIKLRFLGYDKEITWMIPVLVMGVPLLDTGLVVWSRLRRGVNPLTTPGKDHLSHRLLLLGLGRVGVLAVIYAGSIVLGATAFMIKSASYGTAYAALAAVSALAGLAVILLERVYYAHGGCK